jgi:uncharacterized membrane protein
MHPGLRGRGLIASRTGAVAAAVLLVGPLWYPVAAAVSKTQDYSGAITLDGWNFLDTFAKGDADAVRWLNSQAIDGSRIVEAVGGGYTEHGRIAAATGLPTVLGWPGHERQWRGSDEAFAGREEDVRRLYETTSVNEAVELIDRYDVRYVVIGARERAAYSVLDASKFDTLGSLVFESNGTSIYQVRGQRLGARD